MATSSAHSSEQRRAHRKRANFTSEVMDVVRDQMIGYLGDLSATGMLLIGTHRPDNGAIYQFRMPLIGLEARPRPIEMGVQALWQRPSKQPGQVWAGFRIIAIGDADAASLRVWLELPV